MFKIQYHCISSWYTFGFAETEEEAKKLVEECSNEGWLNIRCELVG